MKLIRFGNPGEEQPGVLLPSGRMIDATEFAFEYDEDFFAEDGLDRLTAWVEKYGHSAPEVMAGTRLGPPVARPSKIICVGLNYRKHAEETGADIPTEPVLFMKASSALCGPFDQVVIPRGSEQTDWEVELAVVIGDYASYVTEEDALNYVAGYALHNDYSERAFQKDRGGQWVKGKSCDTFAPLGPWLVTKDEIPNPQNLRLWLKVNGEKVQDSNTSDMIFSVAEVVSYISQFMTLLPGDVISTGTPSGVGLGFKPPRFLKAGDTVELGIDGLGESKQTAIRWEDTLEEEDDDEGEEE